MQFLIKLCSVCRVRIRQLANLVQTPEDRIAGPGTRAILFTDSYSPETFLVKAEVRAASVEQVEDVTKLDVFAYNFMRQIENSTGGVRYDRRNICRSFRSLTKPLQIPSCFVGAKDLGIRHCGAKGRPGLCEVRGTRVLRLHGSR